ncbi:hypothetical protein D5S17_12755 [Pseudonocardiaceae bacterium YIM PH 21723]|nr:hypothetical protein D5S17_12755 [Pseudonocardiaceae bacterium YIM PH 21723]
MTSRALLDYARLLEVIAQETELLAGSYLPERAGEVVPACQGLTLQKVVRHVAEQYRRACHWIERGLRPELPLPPMHTDPVEDLREAAGELLGVLALGEPETAAASWWPQDRSYGFWARRMAHESTVHRVDVQSAAVLPQEEIAEDVAVDGIDEVLTLWYGHRLTQLGVVGSLPAAVGVRSGERHWLTQAGAQGTTARRVGSGDLDEAAAVVTGSPEAVYLWLWGRRPDQAVGSTGDYDARAQLWALLRLATR